MIETLGEGGIGHLSIGVFKWAWTSTTLSLEALALFRFLAWIYKGRCTARVVGRLWPLHINRLLHLFLDFEFLLVANRSLFLLLILISFSFGTLSFHRYIDWLDNEDGLLYHRFTILVSLLLSKSFKLLRAHNFVLYRPFVVNFLHHVQ